MAEKQKCRFYTERQVARLVILAQTASDSGKGIHEMDLHPSLINRESEGKGYKIKPYLIAEAIKTIERSNSRWRFYCIEKEDQNGYPSVLVYFQWKELQISFHTPKGRGDNCLIPYMGKGTPIIWDKQSSREACKRLQKIFKIL